MQPRRYKRKLTEVYAIQLLASEDNRLAKYLADLADGVEGERNGSPYISIRTSVGMVLMREGDYLIVDEDGVYPCAAEEFDRKYVLDVEPRPYEVLEILTRKVMGAMTQGNGRNMTAARGRKFWNQALAEHRAQNPRRKRA